MVTLHGQKRQLAVYCGEVRRDDRDDMLAAPRAVYITIKGMNRD